MLPISTTLITVSVIHALRGGGARIPPPPPPPLSPTYNKLRDNFYKWPEPLRFFISGNVGNLVFFVLEHLVHSILKDNLEVLPTLLVEYKDGASFMVAYFLQIISQHWLHAFLVYGMDTISTREKYVKTLIGCYST
jgi:hypothetical protein